jgi:threonine dehydrogenase-like Zn-dependent dehydrogenase
MEVMQSMESLGITLHSICPRRHHSKVGNVYREVEEEADNVEAATIPLAAMTAALGLYQRLELPLPFRPATSPIPLVVYGGSSAVGAFAIKLATQSNIHPIIAIAGKSSDFVEKLIDRSKGDTIIDYRKGDEAIVKGIKEALGDKELLHAYDATAEGSTGLNISKVLAKGGIVTAVLPNVEVAEGVDLRQTMVGSVHQPEPSPTGGAGPKDRALGDPEFGSIFFPLFTRGLAHGWFTPHPFEVVPGGLEGVETALKNLAAGKASAVKYVLRIADTPGAGQDKV